MVRSGGGQRCMTAQRAVPQGYAGMKKPRVPRGLTSLPRTVGPAAGRSFPPPLPEPLQVPPVLLGRPPLLGPERLIGHLQLLGVSLAEPFTLRILFIELLRLGRRPAAFGEPPHDQPPFVRPQA
jgi:hypothetical protein